VSSVPPACFPCFLLMELTSYGELMDAIYLHQKYSRPMSYDSWKEVQMLVDYVSTLYLLHSSLLRDDPHRFAPIVIGQI
jgi:hypothetical protein